MGWGACGQHPCKALPLVGLGEDDLGGGEDLYKGLGGGDLGGDGLGEEDLGGGDNLGDDLGGGWLR